MCKIVLRLGTDCKSAPTGFSQPETGAWQTDVFILLATYMSEINSTIFYSKGIPLRNTLNEYFKNGENLLIQSSNRKTI
jgi:hypothetical protein